MGGPGSGRKPNPVQLFGKQQIGNYGNEEAIVLPDYSGVAHHKRTQGKFVLKAGDTMTGDLKMGDNIKHVLGDSDDASIYFNGSRVRIDHSNLRIGDESGNQTLSFIGDGTGVLIWHGDFVSTPNDFFNFQDDVSITSGEKLYFNYTDTSEKYITHGTDTRLDFFCNRAGGTGVFRFENGSATAGGVALALRDDGTNAVAFKLEASDSPAHLQMIPAASFDMWWYEDSTSGENKEIRLYGYPTGATLDYASLQIVNTTNDLQINTNKSGSAVEFTGDVRYVNSGSGIPYGEIWVKDNSTADTVATATNTQVTRFDTDGESNQCTPSHTNDHITIDKAGMYLVTISLAFSGDASVEWDFTLYKNNGNTAFNNVHTTRKLGAGGDVGSASLSGICDFAVNDTIELWMQHAAGVNKNITIEDCTLSVVQVGGT